MIRIFRMAPVALLAVTFAMPALAQGAATSQPAAAGAKKMRRLVKKAGTAATNSSLVAVDYRRRIAFVARGELGGVSGDGLIDVINLKVDPNSKDPRKAVIDLGHPDYPIGLALDTKRGLLFVASGDNGSDGKLDIIKERKLKPISGSPFAFPAGSDTGTVGQLVFDPIRRKLIVAMIKTGESAGDAPSATTGFAVFDLRSKSFGPVIQAASSDNFGFNAITNVVISPADNMDPTIDAVDIGNGVGCLSDPADSNLLSEDDPDGGAFDPATNVAVVGDDGDPDLVIMNLNGSSFVNESSPPCTLVEGGTPPNSVFIATGFPAPAGVAVNVNTHQLLAEQSSGEGLALIQLPTSPVTQIDSSTTFEISEAALPNNPDDSAVRILGFPYSAAIDPKRNLGYGNSNGTYLVQIDLNALQNNPSGINTALPSGNCTGTSTTLGCSNGAGVTYFPLSDWSAE